VRHARNHEGFRISDGGLRAGPRSPCAIPATACRRLHLGSPRPRAWWLRPRRCLYAAKPREGIRASRPNGYWHLDVTVIKLLDGTRTYLHAAMDNFNRRILAWKLMLHLEPNTTCQLLAEEAVQGARELFALVSRDRARVLAAGKASVVASRLFEEPPRHPIVTITGMVTGMGGEVDVICVIGRTSCEAATRNGRSYFLRAARTR
jgi:hypothetical protein